MAKKCEITGKKVMVGNNFPKSAHKTRRTFEPNLQRKTLLVDGKKTKMRISTTAIRTLKKRGEVSMNGKKVTLFKPTTEATKS